MLSLREVALIVLDAHITPRWHNLSYCTFKCLNIPFSNLTYADIQHKLEIVRLASAECDRQLPNELLCQIANCGIFFSKIKPEHKVSRITLQYIKNNILSCEVRSKEIFGSLLDNDVNMDNLVLLLKKALDYYNSCPSSFIHSPKCKCTRDLPNYTYEKVCELLKINNCTKHGKLGSSIH